MNARNVNRRAAALAIVLLAGCAGGHAGTNLLPATGTTPASRNASATIRITIPPKALSTAISPEYVSASTQSITVVTVDANNIPNGSLTIVNATPGSAACPAPASGQPLVCTAQADLPVGSDHIQVVTYDGQNGTGTMLSTAVVSFTVVADTVNTIPITLNGVVHSVLIGFDQTTVTQGTASTIHLYVTALDPDGNIIAGSGSFAAADGTPVTIGLASSDPSVTLASTSVTGPLPSPMNVTYNGAAVSGGEVDVTATAANVPLPILPAKLFIGHPTPYLYALQIQTAATMLEQTPYAEVSYPLVSVYPSATSGATSGTAAVRTIAPAASGPAGVYEDSSGTRYVAMAMGGTATGGSLLPPGEIDIYPKGATTPSRVISGSATGLDLPVAVYADSNYIYVANNGSEVQGGSDSITVYPANANGNTAPVRTITGALGGPTQILADSSGDIYVLEYAMQQVAMWQGNQSGSAAPAYYTAFADATHDFLIPTAMNFYANQASLVVGGQNGSGQYELEVLYGGASLTNAPQQAVTVNMPSGYSGVTAVATYAGGFWIGSTTANGQGALQNVASNGNVAATITGSAAGLEFISSITTEPVTNNPVVSSFETGTIDTFAASANGNVAPIAALSTDGTGMLNPVGIAVARDGTVAVADRGSPGGAAAPRVLFYASGASGAATPARTLTLSAAPNAVAFDDNANVYVALPAVPSASATNMVEEFAAGVSGSAAPVRTIDVPNAYPGGVLSVAVDGSGYVYAATYDAIDVYAPGNASAVHSYAPPSGQLWSQLAVTSQGEIAASYGATAGASATGIEVFPPGSGSGTAIAGSSTQLKAANFGVYGSSVGIDGTGNIYAGTSQLFWFASGSHGNAAPAATYTVANSATETWAMSFGP